MSGCERCAQLEAQLDELRRALAQAERERDAAARFEDAPFATALLDGTGTVLQSNARFAALLGLELTDARGLQLEAAVAVPQHAARLREHVEQVLTTNQVHACDVWLRRPGGAVTRVRVQSSPAGAPPHARCRAVLFETPAGGASEPPREHPSSRPPPPNGDPLPGGLSANPAASATVLVVEDEALVRKAVQYYLSSAGYRVLVASDRPGALRCAEDEVIDLVLTDLSLGDGATGPEVVEEVRARWPEIAVLYMTACPPELLARRGFHVPAGETLEKPFSKDKLLARVTRALSAARVKALARDEQGASGG